MLHESLYLSPSTFILGTLRRFKSLDLTFRGILLHPAPFIELLSQLLDGLQVFHSLPFLLIPSFPNLPLKLFSLLVSLPLLLSQAL